MAGGGEGGGKVTGIRQVVRLKQMLQKWHAMAGWHKEEDRRRRPPKPKKRPNRAYLRYEGSDEESCRSPGQQQPSPPPPDVPRGYCPVYVGPEQRRFVIPTRYLSLPVFKLLLEKAEEEFGFDHGGALTIPCEIETFKYILQCMEQHAKGLIDDEGNPTAAGLEE